MNKLLTTLVFDSKAIQYGKGGYYWRRNGSTEWFYINNRNCCVHEFVRRRELMIINVPIEGIQITCPTL